MVKIKKQITWRRWVCGALLVLGTGAQGAQQFSRARYQPIIDREPFGSEPIETAPSAPKVDPAALAAEVSAELRLCMLLEDDAGAMRAGIAYKKAQPKGSPNSFVLSVNESHDSVKLIGVDVESKTATVMQRGKKIVLQMEKAKSPVKTVAPRTTSRRRSTRPIPSQGRTQPKPEPRKQPTPEEREQIRENLRNYQMEVIRKGMPPLPIPLTEDMDAQLVAEGVLPPEE